MKVSVEEINGRQVTVIWHEESQHTTLGRRFVTLDSGVLEVFKDANCLEHIATALPPLPRKPTKGDAALLHLYAANNLMPVMTYDNGNTTGALKSEATFMSEEWHQILSDSDDFKQEHGYVDEITHALLPDGTRCEIAIKEG